LEAHERRRHIAEAAYYKAERRGFDGDRALDDWIEAERELAAIVPPEHPHPFDAERDAAADVPQPDQRSGTPVPAPLAKEDAIRVDEAKESAEQLKNGQAQ
jgi:hypothetical protein